VSETVVVWLLPLAEAITVIFEVPLGVTFTGGGVVLLELPPQATAPVKITKTQSRTNAGSTVLCVCCFRIKASISSTSKLRNANGKTGLGPLGEPGNGPKTDPEPVVVMVSVVAADAPFGVICAGLKLQLAPAGRPEQESDIALLALGAVAKLIVNVADAPADTIALVGDADTVNGTELVPTICVIAAEVLAAKFESPLYAAVIESVPVGSDEVVNVATPLEFMGCETSAVPLSLNVTVPVGTPEVDGVTVAVSVTDCPGVDGSAEELVTTVVGA
jgi:hypothetical protein